LVPKERSLHEVFISEISEPYPYGSKDIAQVKAIENMVKVQGHKVKSLGTKRKISS
jgi:hypothetical protein